MIKRYIQSFSPLIVSLLLYLAATLVIFPFGEFAVNDDWIFKRQIEAFSLGKYALSNLIDPSFIAQGIIGYLWSLIFGHSFTSLKILTTVITILSVLGLYKIFIAVGLSRRSQIIGLITFLFNPLVFHLSTTFMSDMYFLFALIWSLLYLIKGYQDKRLSHIFTGLIFAFLAVLIRQIGVVIFLTFWLCLLIFSLKKVINPKFAIKSFVISTLILAISIIIVSIWPRYGSNTYLSSLIELKKMNSRANLMFWSIPYFAFFLMPLILSVKLNMKKHIKVAISTLSLVLAYFWFKLDVFPVGNILYLEGLNIKAYFRHNLSTLDNIFMKFLFSFLIMFSIISLFVGIYKILRIDKSISFTKLLLILNFLGFFIVLLVSSDYYDRYLLPSFVCLLLFLLILFDAYLKPSRFSVNVTILLMLLTLLLQADFINLQKLKWKQATVLQKEKNLHTQIYLDGVYAKYTHAVRENDYEGIKRTQTTSTFKCYVQEYNIDTDSMALKIMKDLQNFATKMIDNPRAPDTRKPEGLPKIKNNLDKLELNNEYISPLYNIIGKKSYVGSWCIE